MAETIIDSITKYHLTEEDILRITHKALGEKVHNITAKELAGGLCSAVYLIEADGQKLVLKVAAKRDVITMRHEKDYVITEAKMLQRIGTETDIPMPKLVALDDSCTILQVPYFFMTYISGQSLGTMNPRPTEERIREIKREVGRSTRKMTSILADQFGIPAMPETYTNSNATFVSTLFELLLQDANDKNITIPGITSEKLLELIHKGNNVLDEVKQPCFAHTDTWDGNLMIENDKLSGIVDFAAVLYGDPLLSHDFHDLFGGATPEFLEGYGKEILSKNEEVRIQIYRVWQCLGMVVERGFRQYEDPNQYIWILDLFKQEVERLKAIFIDF